MLGLYTFHNEVMYLLYTHVRAHTQTHTDTHTDTHTQTQTHRHTHTHTQSKYVFTKTWLTIHTELFFIS